MIQGNVACQRDSCHQRRNCHCLYCLSVTSPYLYIQDIIDRPIRQAPAFAYLPLLLLLSFSIHNFSSLLVHVVWCVRVSLSRSINRIKYNPPHYYIYWNRIKKRQTIQGKREEKGTQRGYPDTGRWDPCVPVCTTAVAAELDWMLTWGDGWK